MVSTHGRLFDILKNKFIEPNYKNGISYIENGVRVYPSGHGRVSIRTENGTVMTYIHRIVMDVFGGQNKENKLCVDHIDTDTHNNCIENLRYATHTENANNINTKYNRQNNKAKNLKTKPLI